MKAALDARGLCLTIDGRQVLHQVDFFLNKGEASWQKRSGKNDIDEYPYRHL